VIVEVLYTNHRGEKGWRRINPLRLFYGASEHHPAPQWLLECYDFDRAAGRTYAMSGIEGWRAAEQLETAK
jgi:predicted DNA-binding transcriptional regulator YafY